MITFDPLWNYLNKNGITKYYLLERGIISRAQLTRLRNNHNFNLKFINSLCESLSCDISDIIKYTDDSE